MSEFKDFRLGSFFNSHLGYKVDKLLSSGSYKVISGVTENNGILGYVNDVGNSKIFTDTITISNRGENSGKAYYQKDDFILSNNAIALEKKLHVKNQLSKHVILYLTASINKLNYGGYGNYPTKAGILEDVLSLPVKSLTDTEPDWEYMEQYIKEIEKKAILKVKEQNEKDIALLKEIIGQEKGSDFTEDVEFREFKVEDLFDVNPTKAYTKIKDEDILADVGFTPFITTTVSNNGVKGFSSLKPLNSGNVISISDTTGTDSIFYQQKPFIGRSHVQGLVPRFTMNRFTALYIVTCIKKSVEGMYSYGTKFNRERIKATCIELPVNKRVSEQVPDWKSIEEYMKHIQQKYIILSEQENENEINNLLSVTGLTPELILSEEGQFA